jgi:hypothetical protein
LFFFALSAGGGFGLSAWSSRQTNESKSKWVAWTQAASLSCSWSMT